MINKDNLKIELHRRRRLKLESSFYEFVQAAWHIVEPGSPFLDGLHIRTICDHVQAVVEGKIPRLLINVPPRHSKSTIVSVMLTPWVWARNPSKRFLFGSYSASLAQRDSVRARRIIESEWFRSFWPNVFLKEDTNTKAEFENSSTGTRTCVSTGSATTGKGGDFLIIDDPLNALDADSEVEREKCITWFKESFSTRANSSKAAFIVVMQRLHERDLSGFIVDEQKGLGWTHVCLPFEKEEESKDQERKPNTLGWFDPRSEGQVLWPERFDNALEIELLKATLGPYGVAGQLQQRPVPRGGGTFKTEWLRFWYDESMGVPESYVTKTSGGIPFSVLQKPLPKIDETTKISSWDLSFKETAKSDFVVGQMWARARSSVETFLLKQYRARAGFGKTQDAILEHLQGEDCLTTLVEDKANGSAIIDQLKSEVAGLIAVDPRGGKIARANACEALFQSGQVWFPHPKQFPWVEELIKELLSFPKGQNDDQVDAMTQALVRMQKFRQHDLDLGSVITANKKQDYDIPGHE
jgi:predicted phage terminase large subunit-like protein